MVGQSIAKEMILTGRIYNHEQGLKLGILDNISVDPMDASMELAQEISKNAPLALRMAKLAIDKGGLQSLNSEREAYEVVLQSLDRIEGLNAFREKRSPIYRGE